MICGEDDCRMKKTALLVVDVQNLLVEYCHQGEEIVERIKHVIAEARTRELPVLYVQHNTGETDELALGSPGWEIPASIKPEETDPVFHKMAPDSFYETGLHEKLQSLAIEKLIIAGFQTNYCIDTTSRSAISHDYDVILVGDCHSTTDTSVLKAPDIIAHHNNTLSGFGSPKHTITVKQSASLWEA